MSVGAVDPIAEEEKDAQLGLPGKDNRELDDLLASETPPAGEAEDPKDLIMPTPPAPNPNAVAPANIAPPPDFGPPAPQPATDAILAKLPPPLTPGAPTPGPTAGPPPPLGSIPAATEDEETPAVTPESVIEEKRQLGRRASNDEILAAADARDAAHAYQQDVNAAVEKGNRRLDEKRQIYDDALANYQSMHPRDYFENHNKLAAGIALALGGLGAAFSAAGGGPSENRALTQLNRQMDTDYQHQLGQIEKARDEVAMARTGINDAKEAKEALVEDATAKWVAQKQAAETEARFQLAERKVPANDIEAHEAILQLAQNRKAAEIAADERRRKDTHMDMQDDLLKAQAERARQQAAVQAKKAKGGGGGSASSEQKGEAYSNLLDMIENGKEGPDGKTQPYSTKELNDYARQNGIPPTGKAGASTLDTALKTAKFVQRTNDQHSATNERLGLMGDRQLEKNVNDFRAQHQIPKIEASYRRLQEVKEMLDSGNPTSAMTALMEYDQGAKGAAATEASMHALKEHLGGSWDQMRGWIEGKQTGNFGPGQIKNLEGAVDVALKSFKNSVEPIHAAFYERFDGSKPEVKNQAAGLFSTFGYKEKGAPAAASAVPAKPAQMKIGNTVYNLQPDGTYK